MNALRLLAVQVSNENRTFWRNPAAAFFTVFFPLMFLVVFNLLFGENQIDVHGGVTDESTFYVPAIAAFAVISACYTNIAMMVTGARDRGLLKRFRGTPLPPWVFLAGRIIHATLVALLLTAVIAVAGALFYDVDIPTNTMPALIVTLAIGDIFPVRHFSEALQAVFNPYEDGAGFDEPWRLAIIGAWGVVGLLLAMRFFSWEPRR